MWAAQKKSDVEGISEEVQNISKNNNNNNGHNSNNKKQKRLNKVLKIRNQNKDLLGHCDDTHASENQSIQLNNQPEFSGSYSVLWSGPFQIFNSYLYRFSLINYLFLIPGGDNAGWSKHWDVCWDFHNDCNVGGRRLYQWQKLYNAADDASSVNWTPCHNCPGPNLPDGGDGEEDDVK